MEPDKPSTYNLQQEQLILPERVTVRDPRGGQYVIVSVLGKGEFGAVYLVRERQSKRDLFALKEIINPNKDEREHFTFEAEVLKRLNHVALPRVHRVFENDRLKRVYLLMDYISGRNLEALRQEQPAKCFSLPLALALLAPIADALSYLHAQVPPIVHRDVKPANIIVPEAGGQAMLVDFGSAKEFIPGSVTNVVSRRTPGYAAPELYRTGTNPRTDIYGLGATLYVLLTGVAPVDAPSRIAGNWSTRTDPLNPAHLLNSTIPIGVSEALQRAMAMKTEDRFGTVAEFWRVLTAQSMQQMASTPPLEISQPHPTQPIEDAPTQPLRKELYAPRSKKRRILRIFGLLKGHSS